MNTDESSGAAVADGLVVIGAIERSFGIKGELCVQSLSDVPGRFRVQAPVVLVGPQGRRVQSTVTSVRPHGTRLIVGVDAVRTPEDVGPYRGGYLYAERGQALAPPGQYFQCDLLGLTVEQEDGRVLGTLDHILETPAHHVFVVRRGAEESLVPAVKEWVVKIDLEARVMTVRAATVIEVDGEASKGGRHAV